MSGVLKEGSERDPRHDPWFVDGRDVKTPYSVEEVRQMVALCDDDPGTWTPRNRRLMATVLSLADSISETVQAWVPVLERMPGPEEDEIIVAVTKLDGSLYVTALDVEELHEIVADCREHDEACAYTHWQPMPAPPKGTK